MNMVEYFEDEIKGFMEYYSLALEYKNSELYYNFKEMAKDELKHARFWLDLLYYSEYYDEKYEKEYEECKELAEEVNLNDKIIY